MVLHIYASLLYQWVASSKICNYYHVPYMNETMMLSVQMKRRDNFRISIQRNWRIWQLGSQESSKMWCSDGNPKPGTKYGYMSLSFLNKYYWKERSFSIKTTSLEVSPVTNSYINFSIYCHKTHLLALVGKVASILILYVPSSSRLHLAWPWVCSLLIRFQFSKFQQQVCYRGTYTCSPTLSPQPWLYLLPSTISNKR